MQPRIYQKADPSIEPLEVEKEEVVEGTPERVVPLPATRYSKGEAIIEPEAFFVVFSNGEVREKNYFSWMMRNCPRLKLEFEGIPQSPDDLLVKAVEKKEEYAKTASEMYPDKYYAVTDVDHFYNDIVRSQDDYVANGIQLVISNPCFEVWLYYSKRDDMFDGFLMPDNLLKLSQEVKHFLNQKIPGGCNPKRAVFDIKDNISNARLHYAEDCNGVPVVFTTNMFVLAEDLLPHIEIELERQISLMNDHK